VNPQLTQAREAWQRTIDENPEVIILYRKATRVNSFGETVENPYGLQMPITAKVRISHESKVGEGAGPGGLSEEMNRYIMVNYKTTILHGDVFEAIGKRFRIETVDPIHQYGGIAGYRASLIEAVGEEATT